MTKAGSLVGSMGGCVCPGGMLGKLVVLVKCESSPGLLAGLNGDTAPSRTQSELHHQSAEDVAKVRKKRKKNLIILGSGGDLCFALCHSRIKHDITVRFFSLTVEWLNVPAPSTSLIVSLPNEVPSRHMGADGVKKNTPLT